MKAVSGRLAVFLLEMGCRVRLSRSANANSSERPPEDRASYFSLHPTEVFAHQSIKAMSLCWPLYCQNFPPQLIFLPASYLAFDGSGGTICQLRRRVVLPSALSVIKLGRKMIGGRKMGHRRWSINLNIFALHLFAFRRCELSGCR